MNQAHQTPAVVAIIPARFGSTRFPGKPLALIAGKTLLQRTYESAKKCPSLDKILIATDDDSIYQHALSFDADVVMTPVDCPTGSDRLAFVLNQDLVLQNAQIIVNVQGDEPCLAPETLTALVDALKNDPQAVMSTAAYPLTCPNEAVNPNTVKCIFDVNGNAIYFSRALIPAGRVQTFREGIPYYKHVGIYAYRPSFLMQYAGLPMTPLQIAEDLEQLKVLENGYKIKVAIVNSIGPDVNTPEDLKKVEQELCKQNLSSSPAASAHP